MSRYEWKSASKESKFDVTKLGAEIEAMTGPRTADRLIIHARKDQASELYRYLFAEADAEAAYNWRLEKARYLLKNIVIKQIDDRKPTAIELSVRSFDRKNRRGSGPGASSAVDAEQVVEEVLRDLLSVHYKLQSRAADIPDFEDAARAVRLVIRRLEKKSKRKAS